MEFIKRRVVKLSFFAPKNGISIVRLNTYTLTITIWRSLEVKRKAVNSARFLLRAQQGQYLRELESLLKRALAIREKLELSPEQDSEMFLLISLIKKEISSCMERDAIQKYDVLHAAGKLSAIKRSIQPFIVMEENFDNGHPTIHSIGTSTDSDL